MTTMRRSIERVSVPFLAALAAAECLPSLSSAIAELNVDRERMRDATVAEVDALTWIVCWPAGPGEAIRAADGVAAYREIFDYATCTDAIEIIHIAGSARACARLLREMRDIAHRDGRRLMGAIDVENSAMAKAIRRVLGAEVTRYVFESKP